MLLLHHTDMLEQATGFEPVYPTWQAGVMATIRCLHFGTQSGDRTHDFLFVGQALSQAELSGYDALLLNGEVLKNRGGPHGDRTRHLRIAKPVSPHCDFWPMLVSDKGLEPSGG